MHDHMNIKPTSTVNFRPDWLCLSLLLVPRLKRLRKCGRFHKPEPKRRASPEPMAGGLPQRRHNQQKFKKAYYSSNDTVLLS
jgi:hypothetical protein